MSSRNIRGIVALAALTTGLCTATASPAAADSCADPGLLPAAPLTGECGETTNVGVIDYTGSAGRLAEGGNALAMAAGEMARRIGLSGLAMPGTGMADLGGVTATWGMPSLSGSSPAALAGLPLMRDLTTMARVPTLPALPQFPGTGSLPVGVSFGDAADAGRVADDSLRAPMNLREPLAEIGDQVFGRTLSDVPKTLRGLGEATRLPVGQPALDGVTGLLQGLNPR
ncbi:hypothetical protein HII36_05975 [Nonomuraea sp. NN258]|uniref:hypothetical protein n=1 Tax=Nonomuraea antri TaxID=2730852 RepID=UPI00156A44BB|nr:hypothetical protein [Nonomuraea antri]NRQ31387.1 hypothetical protein [Nonomuraea antri]